MISLFIFFDERSIELEGGGHFRSHFRHFFFPLALRSMVLVLAIHTVGAVTAKVR